MPLNSIPSFLQHSSFIAMMTALAGSSLGQVQEGSTWPGQGLAINIHTGYGIEVGVDHSTLQSLTFAGQEPRFIFDARVGFINPLQPRRPGLRAPSLEKANS